jgi:hypothetical protein
MRENDEISLQGFKQEIYSLLKEKAIYAKLTTIEYTVRFGGLVISKAILALISLFSFVFLALGFSVWLSNLFKSTALGFSTTGIILLLVVFMIKWFFSKSLTKYFANSVLKIFTKLEKETNS